jgi:hypothetical protein
LIISCAGLSGAAESDLFRLCLLRTIVVKKSAEADRGSYSWHGLKAPS